MICAAFAQDRAETNRGRAIADVADVRYRL